MNINILEYLNNLLKGTDIKNLTIKKGATIINITRSLKQIDIEKKPKKQTTPKPAQIKSPVADKEEQKEEQLITLKSNTVGVFYRGKTKLSAAVVKIGSEIKKGQQVGIIDCMGVIEKVSANSSGIIKEVLAENHKPVEYGQPLFVIEPK